MFMMVNRHREILATDGEFYPADVIGITRTAHVFADRESAEQRQRETREYTAIYPVESSL